MFQKKLFYEVETCFHLTVYIGMLFEHLHFNIFTFFSNCVSSNCRSDCTTGQ